MYELRPPAVFAHEKRPDVDWLLDLAHNGNMIIVWSLSGPTQSRKFEPVAGTTEERIEAARKAQEAGYTIRYKFKPIIPVREWREDAAYTIAEALSRTRPDVISLCVFMWLSFEEMSKCLDLDALVPEYVAAARAAAEELENERTRPFPPEVREEVYRFHYEQIRRHDRDVPVSISTESAGMWRQLGQYGQTTQRTQFYGQRKAIQRQAAPVHG